ncbi:MAG: HAMP domain-containing sensor histidine kinase [Planctomycetota bacterium]
MVARWKIRKKFRWALWLIAGVVGVLAISACWGLSRYQQLANEINHRSRLLPNASELNRIAQLVRKSHDRYGDLMRRRGMIEPWSTAGLPGDGELGTTLLDVARMESDHLDDYVFHFGIQLDIYKNESTQHAFDQEHRMTLLRLEQDFKALVQYNTRPPVPNRTAADHQAGLQELIQALVASTDDHLKRLHDSLGHFADQAKRRARTAMYITVASSILCFAVVLLVLQAFRTQVSQPFENLVDGAREISRNNYAHRIEVQSDDEIGMLANLINEMTDKFDQLISKMERDALNKDEQVKEKTREVIQNEQLASAGFLAAGVSHEMNNPLAAIAWNAESLSRRLPDLRIDANDAEQSELYTDLGNSLAMIEREAYRLHDLAENLRNFCRLGDVEREPCDLVALIEDVVEITRTVARFQCKTVKTDLPSEFIAHINHAEIRSVILNLLANALESVDRDGEVRLSLRQNQRKALIVVTDNGCGMTQEVLEHLFQPFFTRRRDGTGTGLGLSVSYRIISKHGGSLIPSSPGEGMGSRMEISIPMDPAECDSVHCHEFDEEAVVPFSADRWNHVLEKV